MIPENTDCEAEKDARKGCLSNQRMFSIQLPLWKMSSELLGGSKAQWSGLSSQKHEGTIYVSSKNSIAWSRMGFSCLGHVGSVASSKVNSGGQAGGAGLWWAIWIPQTISLSSLTSRPRTSSTWSIQIHWAWILREEVVRRNKLQMEQSRQLGGRFEVHVQSGMG